jgi:hypothetical protein
MRRGAAFLVGGNVIIAGLVATLVLTSGEVESDEAETTEVRQETTTEEVLEETGALVQCLERSTLTADIDGDGLPDLVYHDYLGMRGAILGACTAAGGFDEIPGKGQSQTIRVGDLSGDGRDEIVFGAPLGISHNGLFLGVWIGDGLHEVTRRDGRRFMLMSGQVHRGDGTLRAEFEWGCEDVDGSDEREIVQVRVRPSWDSGSARWTRVGYRLEDSTVRISSRSRGRLPQSRVRTGVTGPMVQRCDLREYADEI